MSKWPLCNCPNLVHYSMKNFLSTSITYLAIFCDYLSLKLIHTSVESTEMKIKRIQVLLTNQGNQSSIA